MSSTLLVVTFISKVKINNMKVIYSPYLQGYIVSWRCGLMATDTNRTVAIQKALNRIEKRNK